MKMIAPLLLLAFSACAAPAVDGTGPEDRGVPAVDDLTALRHAVAGLEARVEHDAPRVKVEHILISFAGTGTSATRTRAEAEALAASLLARIEAGEDFSTLKIGHSDDGPGGIYTMVQQGPADRENLIFSRRSMVAAFGNTGWRLEVGQVGVAQYDPQASKYGWHIIRRLE